MGQVRILHSCCESLCNFMGSKLESAGGLVVSASDYEPRDGQSTPQGATLILS